MDGCVAVLCRALQVLVHRDQVLAEQAPLRLQLLTMAWAKHHDSLSKFIVTKASPPLMYVRGWARG